MPTFVWKGRTATGASASGELSAGSQADVVAALRQKKIIPTSIKIKEEKKGLTLFGSRVSRHALSVFTRQFSTMLNAGLPLLTCLEILGKQTESQGLRRVLAEVRGDVEGGLSLADALRRQPKVFDNLYVNMVESGETGGALDVILMRLATYLEKTAALMRKIKGALIYPIIISIVAVGAIAVMLLFVIPIFAKMFAGVGAELPAMTRMVIGMSNALKVWAVPSVIIIIALVTILRRWHKTDSGAKVMDPIFLKLPVFGDLIRKQSIARFSRTLSTLLSSGVPIIDALEITAKSAGNWVVEDAILKARTSIKGGENIADPLSKTAVFPPMVTQMIAIGEASGGLDEMLSKVADFYDAEVDQAVENLTNALEPVIMVFLGGIVGFLVISMYLPIFQLAGTITE
ncbi:MAG TPA: type II secretion system F family protein [candidate division WOR-3 bacterium]|uniref:Type II secretion system F family protein n=1 Tax=candidate division WOR-3 bacterium TaxID=2052148 RepID=A0A9C9EKV5_UNCW3|nr:type II secretion system F family protein [candidate division WOR-3 bacterium]